MSFSSGDFDPTLYKTYRNKLNYTMDPFDFREDVAYTGRRLGGKGKDIHRFQ